jgi:hypothetical protein
MNNLQKVYTLRITQFLASVNHLMLQGTAFNLSALPYELTSYLPPAQRCQSPCPAHLPLYNAPPESLRYLKGPVTPSAAHHAIPGNTAITNVLSHSTKIICSHMTTVLSYMDHCKVHMPVFFMFQPFSSTRINSA